MLLETMAIQVSLVVVFMINYFAHNEAHSAKNHIFTRKFQNCIKNVYSESSTDFLQFLVKLLSHNPDMYFATLKSELFTLPLTCET